ncbi:hypothetical protein EYF80_064213 [Liparis tanakae]|uniref:Uncharacterized protein n=1 Tax=Liparis tanakae TaxID=230148 RepID=A0A4Z2E9W5_9TELE|nr:hypothetical protein EYF80_064213 [Liparis tanakae]
MTSPVAKAMLESYALMAMVMGAFFIYFCGMVWIFCNPKLSEEEEEEEKKERETGKPAAGHWGHDFWVHAAPPNPPERNFRCACNDARLPPPAEGLTRTTYVNFWDDDGSLLSDCSTFFREDRGISNPMGQK